MTKFISIHHDYGVTPSYALFKILLPAVIVLLNELDREFNVIDKIGLLIATDAYATSCAAKNANPTPIKYPLFSVKDQRTARIRLLAG